MNNNTKTTQNRLGISKANLNANATRLLGALKRDVNELASLGITAENLSLIEARLHEGWSMGNDSNYREQLNDLVDKKEQSKQLLLNKALQMQLIVCMKLQTPAKDMFQFTRLKRNGISDKSLEITLNNFIQSVNGKLSQNQSIGISNDDIIELTNLLDVFKTNYATIASFVAQRHEATISRNMAMNELFNEIKFLSKGAYDFWKLMNDDRANDYYIYKYMYKKRQAIENETIVEPNTDAA